MSAPTRDVPLTRMHPQQSKSTSAKINTARPPGPATDIGRALEIFIAERPILLQVAYRVVADWQTAEDVVQETWIRWQRADHRAVRTPGAFLTTCTTRLAINTIQSARSRHEVPAELFMTYPPAEVHDTVPGEDGCCGPEIDDVEQLIHFMMARLSPAELAARLLRKCFGYPYTDIAQLLLVTPANARQLVSRSRLDPAMPSGRRPNRDVDHADRHELAVAFLTASRTGELGTLEMILVRIVAGARQRAA